MAQAITLPAEPAAHIGRRALFLMTGATAGMALAALLLLAIGATITTAPQAGLAVVAIVLATYAGGGVLVGSILADASLDIAS